MASNQEEETHVSEITLQVPVAFEIPVAYTSADATTTALMLKLGADSYELMRKQSEKTAHATVYEALRIEARTELTPQIAQLEKELNKVKDSLAAKSRRLEEEELARQQTEQRVREEERRNREDLLRARDALIQQLREDSQRDKTNLVTEVRNQLQSMRDTYIKQSASSKTKGEKGEMQLEEILTSAFRPAAGGHFQIANVGKEAHKGDIHMTYKHTKIMVEVKNYDRHVAGKEVEKFLDDMDKNKEFELGLMISLTSGITGHNVPGDFDFGELGDGRPLLFINNLYDKEDRVSYLQGLLPFIDTVLRYRKKQVEQVQVDSAALEQVNLLKKKRDRVLKRVKEYQDRLKRFKVLLMKMRDSQKQQIEELLDEFKENEADVKRMLASMLELDDDEPMDNVIVPLASQLQPPQPHLHPPQRSPRMSPRAKPQVQAQQTLIELPAHVFQITDLDLLESKDQQRFVRVLFEKFEVGNDEQMSRKEFKDAFKAEGFSDDLVSAIAKRLFTPATWKPNAKNVQYITPKNEFSL
jgi:hypothetical protein